MIRTRIEEWCCKLMMGSSLTERANARLILLDVADRFGLDQRERSDLEKLEVMVSPGKWPLAVLVAFGLEIELHRKRLAQLIRHEEDLVAARAEKARRARVEEMERRRPQVKIEFT